MKYIEYGTEFLDQLKDRVHTQYELLQEKDKEIERLKESEEYHRVGYAELYKRIDEAIEYIERALKDDYSEFMYMYEPEEILKILKGE